MAGSLSMLQYALIVLAVCVATASAASATCPKRHMCEAKETCVKQHGGKEQLAAKVLFHCGDSSLICCPPLIETDTQIRRQQKQKATQQRRERNRKIFDTPDCGKTFSSRILAGDDAGPGDFPWMARVGSRGWKDGARFHCGGSLISKRYVLTAAQCIAQHGFVDIVRLGETDTTTDPDCYNPSNGMVRRASVNGKNAPAGEEIFPEGMGSAYDVVVDDEYIDYVESMALTGEPCYVPKVEDFGVEEVVKNKHYSSTTNLNDIALLRLDRDVEFNEYVLPICLPWKPHKMPTTLFIVGWGRTMDGEVSTVLKTGKVSRIDMDDCMYNLEPRVLARVSRKLMTERQICTLPSGSNACMGDAGGPLAFFEPSLQSQVQVGIVSFGQEGPCSADVSKATAVYTKINAYMDWILDSVTV